MDILDSALRALCDASEHDLLCLSRLEHTKAYDVGKLQLLSRLLVSQSLGRDTRGPSLSSNRAGDLFTVDRVGISSSDSASNIAAIAALVTNLPGDKCRATSDLESRSQATDEFQVTEEDCVTKEDCATEKIVSLLRVLNSRYGEIKELTCLEVKSAVGCLPHEKQDYRLVDFRYGTNASAQGLHFQFRAVLAERSFALSFEKWEKEQYNGYKLSRVQKYVEDITKTKKRDYQPKKFLRSLNISDPDFATSTKALNRGIKHLVIERQLKNCLGVGIDDSESSIDGITALAPFAYNKWYKMCYPHIPVFVQKLKEEEFSNLLALARNKTHWMKEAQQHYDSQGQNRNKPEEYQIILNSHPPIHNEGFLRPSQTTKSLPTGKRQRMRPRTSESYAHGVEEMIATSNPAITESAPTRTENASEVWHAGPDHRDGCDSGNMMEGTAEGFQAEESSNTLQPPSSRSQIAVLYLRAAGSTQETQEQNKLGRNTTESRKRKHHNMNEDGEEQEQDRDTSAEISMSPFDREGATGVRHAPTMEVDGYSIGAHPQSRHQFSLPSNHSDENFAVNVEGSLGLVSSGTSEEAQGDASPQSQGRVVLINTNLPSYHQLESHVNGIDVNRSAMGILGSANTIYRSVGPDAEKQQDKEPISESLPNHSQHNNAILEEAYTPNSLPSPGTLPHGFETNSKQKQLQTPNPTQRCSASQETPDSLLTPPSAMMAWNENEWDENDWFFS